MAPPCVPALRDRPARMRNRELPRARRAAFSCFFSSRVSLTAAVELGSPFVDRLEARAAARVALDPCPELGVGEREVDRDPQRLLDIPRRIDEKLDAVALGIEEVNRERVAMRDGIEFAHALLGDAPMHLAQGP